MKLIGGKDTNKAGSLAYTRGCFRPFFMKSSVNLRKLSISIFQDFAFDRCTKVFPNILDVAVDFIFTMYGRIYRHSASFNSHPCHA